MKVATPAMPIGLVGCTCHWNLIWNPFADPAAGPSPLGPLQKPEISAAVLLKCTDRHDQQVSAAADDVAIDGPLAGKIGEVGKDGRDGGGRGNRGCAKAL